jgi:hypothetical protein
MSVLRSASGVDQPSRAPWRFSSSSWERPGAAASERRVLTIGHPERDSVRYRPGVTAE